MRIFDKYCNDARKKTQRLLKNWVHKICKGGKE